MQELSVDYRIRADQVVKSVTEIVVAVFGGRILSVYLGGSLSRNQMTPTSDIDLMIVFRDSLEAGEHERCMQLRDALQLLSPFRLDMGVEAEAKLKGRPASSGLRKSQCLHGEAFFKDVPAQTIDDFAMRSIHKAIHYMTVLRGRPASNPSPLQWPDPEDRYLGYTRYGDFAGTEVFGEGTRILVDMVTRCTTALIALELGIEVDTKQESIELYQSKLGGVWGELVRETYDFLRKTLEYRLPATPQDQERLTALLHRLLDFENYALSQFQPMILRCLQSDDRRQRTLALVALKNIQFGDAELHRALEAYSGTGHEELLREVLPKYDLKR